MSPLPDTEAPVWGLGSTLGRHCGAFCHQIRKGCGQPCLPGCRLADGAWRSLFCVLLTELTRQV